MIAITITFNIEIVTEQCRILSLAETTITDETVTVAGPHIDFVSLNKNVTGPDKTFTKFILQQTTKTTILTQKTA